MKKLYTLILLLAVATNMVLAQETPEKISGFYRLINPSYEDAVTVNARHDINGNIPSFDNLGQVFEIKSNGIYSAVAEIQEVERQVQEGEINMSQYLATLQQIMALNSWKSSLYPIDTFRCQGVDYAELIKKLPDYADDAIEAYLNDEIADFYTTYKDKLYLLAVFASDIITPANYETLERFTAWTEAYLTKMRSVADFKLYMQPVMLIPEGDSGLPVPTGAYYFEFKTPTWVGSMEKAQAYINGSLIEEGLELDLWGSCKSRILAQIAKEYGEDSQAVKFVHALLGETWMNTVYIVGETEEGDLYVQPLPDTYGTNGVVLTEEDMLRCQWFFLPVDEQNPVTVEAKESNKDAEGNYYTTLCTGFPYYIYSADTKVSIVTNVDAATQTVELQEIANGVVAANTPVVITSKKPQSAILPLEENVSALSSNVLKGTLFAEQNDGTMVSIMLKDDKPAFGFYNAIVPANSAYINGVVIDGVKLVHAAENAKQNSFDLMGRRVANTAAKGVYVVNGKKVVK